MSENNPIFILLVQEGIYKSNNCINNIKDYGIKIIMVLLGFYSGVGIYYVSCGIIFCL